MYLSSANLIFMSYSLYDMIIKVNHNQFSWVPKTHRLIKESLGAHNFLNDRC